MPTITVINNTYTANTPDGVRQCLGFVIHKARLQENRDRAYRAHPISIAYGSGSISSDYGQLVMVGDFLDIIPAQGDRVRRRRWWQASHDASSQRLLPFAAYNRARLTSIQQYSHATEIVVQFGRGSHTRLNLTAPHTQDAIGPYTVRAIRIHNVDGSETVRPMRPSVAELERPRWRDEVPQAGACVAVRNQVRATPPAEFVWGARCEPCDAPEPPVRERPRPSNMEIIEAARVRGRVRRYEVSDTMPVDEQCEMPMGYGFHSYSECRTRADN